MSGRETALTTALRMLRNECHAIMAMSYDAIKDSAGYTNLKVWISRVEEADALLALPPGDAPQTCAWREIATAPKDGTAVWLFADGEQYQGYVDELGWKPLVLGYHGCGCCGSERPEPTHWQPLPAPPVVLVPAEEQQ